VLLVDDHALVRAGFRKIIDDCDEFEVVGEAGDAAAALESAIALQPAIVLMDISLPDGSGIEAIKSIREAVPDCRVVMLSQYDRVHYVEDALRAGATGYLLKTASAQDLTKGLHAALQGSCSLSPEVASRIVESFTEAGSKPRLTTRESEVLRLVAEGMSSKQIALELNISPRTAETHRANVMSKLGFNGIADLVRFAIREGFVAP
jgi:DNA-binding NarL/FixJ family response regulator